MKTFKYQLAFILMVVGYTATYSQSYFSDTLTTLAFGSCNMATLPQRYFDQIVKNKPDVWIWLGDIIYGDSQSLEGKKKRYARVKNNKHYQHLVDSTKIIGVWDDHDYGGNSQNKNYPFKKETQKMLLDFLDEPFSSERRKQEGVYWSYTFGSLGKQVKIILLDMRYFRDPISDTADILGEKQWQWLESELANSTANLTILGSGIQFLAEEHQFEKWCNYPASKARLISLLKKYNQKKVMVLSGDMHYAEISCRNDLDLSYPLYDFTSSGLTHTWPFKPHILNKYRVGKLNVKRNFGLLIFDWKKNELIMQVKNRKNKLLQETKIPSLLSVNP